MNPFCWGMASLGFRGSKPNFDKQTNQRFTRRVMRGPTIIRLTLIISLISFGWVVLPVLK